ncbi:arylphorin subunit alpha-like [Venturia canescens]|uniref:arylphorin subunit alpha-like n=1 Tax=Venturia canescens TaxID=32260 RepID=UPI001C9C1DA5|nr:arylphorin subunit alpha-like [Venturia canescens]
MSKHTVLVLLGLAIATATASEYYDTKTTDKDYLLKQKQIFNLIYHVPQPDIVNPELYKLGQAWNIEEKMDFYANKEAVQDFLKFYRSGMLPRGEMFSVYYPKLMKESYALFRIFYYAKDFDTFFNSALWARVYMNEGSYLCALYQAVLRRPDTKYIRLPPPYEIYPYAFYNSEILEKAKNAHLYREINANTDKSEIIINGNYSGWYIGREYDTEMKLKYFIEDVGFNSFYFYFRQESPFWLNSEDYALGEKDIRGEEYLYGHKQILARYNLERIANGLERIEDFDWNSEFYPGYYPTMTYHNGLPFPQRPHWSKIPHYKYIYSRAIQDYEMRISAAIDLGYVIDADGKQVKIYTPEGLNILGNLIEGNEDSCNKEFYGSIDALGRKILGFNLEPKTPYQIIPSALESFGSCLRDPAFYRLYKRIVQYYFRYKARFEPYTKEEIIYPGLKIESVAVDKLLTYFDDFDATISNGLLVANQKEAETFSVKVRQERLNHKPFTVHIGINSDKAQKVTFKLFLGPKYDGRWNSLDFSKSYKYFYEIDNWIADLTAGENKIERSSNDFFFTIPDDVSSEIYYKQVESALASGENFKYEERIYGFPRRLILPKGRRAGSPYQLFVYAVPVAGEPVHYESRIWGSYHFDRKSFGFPLDRPIEYSNFIGPNVFFKDVTIYHKYDFDINSTV